MPKQKIKYSSLYETYLNEIHWPSPQVHCVWSQVLPPHSCRSSSSPALQSSWRSHTHREGTHLQKVAINAGYQLNIFTCRLHYTGTLPGHKVARRRLAWTAGSGDSEAKCPGQAALTWQSSTSSSLQSMQSFSPSHLHSEDTQ